MPTCQICLREIKAGRGLIAKHGYRRPGQGWQTASCFGAGYRPFEVSCDAIETLIPRLRTWASGHRDAVTKLTANPPAEYDITHRDAYGRPYGAKQIAARPDNFDATNRPPSFAWNQRYAQQFWKQISQLQSNAKDQDAFADELSIRLANWKQVAL